MRENGVCKGSDSGWTHYLSIPMHQPLDGMEGRGHRGRGGGGYLMMGDLALYTMYREREDCEWSTRVRIAAKE